MIVNRHFVLRSIILSKVITVLRYRELSCFLAFYFKIKMKEKLSLPSGFAVLQTELSKSAINIFITSVFTAK